jgi:ubiquinone/menaquinone biosynthesis C-methylase UbiE
MAAKRAMQCGDSPGASQAYDAIAGRSDERTRRRNDAGRNDRADTLSHAIRGVFNPMENLMSITAAAIDFDAIKMKQQATWASGDFAVIGSTLQWVGESLAEAVDVRAGERVLDVAAGNGNATLAAARRFAQVTSTDYVPDLLEKGEARAHAEGWNVTFQVADVEDLPFEDSAFDVVLSTYGAMFTPDHTRPAREMMRVLRSGGRIGLANWTPEGFIGQLFKVVGKYLPPPAGLKSPALWGTEPHIVSLFGSRAAAITCVRKNFNFRYFSSAHWIQIFRDYYGPVHKAFAALDPAAQAGLERDISALLDRMNVAGQHSLVVPAEYLEVVIVKR